MYAENLISVIIPVYNVEKYLSRCIKSVIGQSYEKWELILIDDGSKDGSGAICDKYAILDSRIKVIHKQNGGVSSARNLGLDIAIGEFICFIDSDDWIPCDSLMNLFNTYKQDKKSDLVVGNLDFRELNVGVNPLKECVINFLNTEDDNISYFVLSHISHGPCGKLYKNRIIKENNLQFNTHIKYGEDTLFLREYLMYCNRLSLSDKIVYHYNLLNVNSASKKYFEEENEWLLTTLYQLERFLDKVKINEEEKNRILAIEAFKMVRICIAMPIKVFDKKQAKKCIEKSLECFKRWLFLDTSWALINDSKKDIRNSILELDIDKIYESCLKFYNKNKLKKIIRQYIVRLLKPRIEKKRDNL